MFIFFILSGAVVLLTFWFQDDIREGYGVVERKAAPIRSKVMPVPPRVREILLKYFPYYQKLKEEHRPSFEQKVCMFIYGKRFIPRNVSEVTIEAKVLIAASAVQLTFGLPNVYLQHFNKILVYPNDYYSSLTKHFHKGEVNPRFGIIVLSWQSFVDGYIHPDDATNVGLHEMAHALRLENLIRNEEYHFFDETLLEQFDAYAQNLCNTTVNWSDSFFRPYACANVHEFFAVSIESFFERSQQFKESLPDLYLILTRLLNQDPLLMTV
jgi:Mlc titration factor MtfA (ptsG expression regulator)